jgi:hypothetical protein
MSEPPNYLFGVGAGGLPLQSSPIRKVCIGVFVSAHAAVAYLAYLLNALQP